MDVVTSAVNVATIVINYFLTPVKVLISVLHKSHEPPSRVYFGFV